jgi:ferredoxin-NADP reductase
MSTLFHTLTVRDVRPDTADAVVVSFEVPPELRETFSFTQGQYLTLRQQIAGQDLRRSYSICAGVDDNELRVGVRRVKGGVFSNWVHEQVMPGQQLQVMAPQGRFFLPLQPHAKRHHLGIAGGSGITPVLSILKTVLGREPLSRCTLIYGNRQLRSTMFKEELEDLKNRCMTRLVLHHVFSDEPTDLPLNSGMMNRDKIGEFLAGEAVDESGGHERRAGRLLVDVGGGDLDLLARGVAEHQFGITPRDLDSGEHLSVVGLHNDGVVALFHVLGWIEQRIDDVVERTRGADRGEVRTDSAALIPDPVAGDALQILPRVDCLAPLRICLVAHERDERVERRGVHRMGRRGRLRGSR